MKVLWHWVPCERNSSYNFIPIFLKLCTCFPQGLEMCMWFGYNPWIDFYHFFLFVNFVIFWPQTLWKCRDNGYLVSATPHTILYLSLWNFSRFGHGLEIYMWFGYNPWINFYHFFHFVNFVIFWPQTLWKCRNNGYLVSATPHTILYLSLWNFAHAFAMVSRYAYCIWFGYNPWINFYHFFHFVNFVIFWPQTLWKCRDNGYLVSATPHTILYLSLWNFSRFGHGLEICMWFGYNPWINFCHFFHFVNFVISDLRFYESV